MAESAKRGEGELFGCLLDYFGISPKDTCMRICHSGLLLFCLISAIALNAEAPKTKEKSLDALIARLASKPDDLVLRDIAEMHKNGREAGPMVAKLFSHEDWDVRVAAARTLGYIGYTDGIDELRKLLKDPNDWRLVYVASESLGRLKARSALAELESVAKQHWFPAVRNAARKAVRVIQGLENYKSRWHKSNFPFEYFEYFHAGSDPELMGNESSEKTTTPDFIQETDVLTQRERADIQYEIEMVGYGVDGRHSEKRKSYPVCGLRIDKAYLLGGNRGEWGGELVYMDEKGTTQILVEENTEGIHRMPFGILATVGLAHLSMNSGYLYLVELKPDKTPVATRWKVLPGAPKQSGILHDGSLYVRCNGGNIVITSGGDIRMADNAKATE